MTELVTGNLDASPMGTSSRLKQEKQTSLLTLKCVLDREWFCYLLLRALAAFSCASLCLSRKGNWRTKQKFLLVHFVPTLVTLFLIPALPRFISLNFSPSTVFQSIVALLQHHSTGVLLPPSLSLVINVARRTAPPRHLKLR